MNENVDTRDPSVFLNVPESKTIYTSLSQLTIFKGYTCTCVCMTWTVCMYNMNACVLIVEPLYDSTNI